LTNKKGEIRKKEGTANWDALVMPISFDVFRRGKKKGSLRKRSYSLSKTGEDDFCSGNEGESVNENPAGFARSALHGGEEKHRREFGGPVNVGGKRGKKKKREEKPCRQ